MWYMGHVFDTTYLNPFYDYAYGCDSQSIKESFNFQVDVFNIKCS